MPRPPLADEAGGLYHALNRGNLRAIIIDKDINDPSEASGLTPAKLPHETSLGSDPVYRF